ncbi:MAG: hypothetical protein EXQ58_00610 [Acidobacteria bacterium]|nr:hypothetical protein [Acidobacteriota bacterium]
MNPILSNLERRRRLPAQILFGTAVLWLLGTTTLWAQFPSIRLLTVFPSGGKQASTFEVTVTGTDTDDTDRLYFSHPGVTGSPVMGKSSAFQTLPQPVPGKFKVSISPDVPLGVYELRLIGRYGISNARAFAVGDQAETVEELSNHTPVSATEVPLGITINGHGDEDAADFYRFKGRKGERVTIEGWAQRLDSRMDATIALYDASGRELQSNRDTYRLDPFVDFIVPEDGQYVFKIYDYLYRGGPEYGYRVSVGTQPHIEYVFPSAGLPGSSGPYVIYGQNLPSGRPSSVLNQQGNPLEEKTVDITLPPDAAQLPSDPFLEPSQIVVGGIDYRLGSDRGSSNSVSVQFATAPVTLEKEPNDKPEQAQKVTLPCEINGQFFPQADQDWIAFEAKKGSVYWVEVFSDRLGHATDPAVLLQRLYVDDQGQEQTEMLVEADDWDSYLAGKRFSMGSRDPAVQFKVERDGLYRLQIRDLSGTQESRPSHLYRLSIRESRPDFQLLVVNEDPGGANDDAMIWEPFLRRGGTTRMSVLAWRRDGFDAQIELTVTGLPPGIRWSGAAIPGNSNGTMLIFEADTQTSGWAGSVQVIGRARINGREIVRNAHHASLVWDVGGFAQKVVHSRVVRNLTLAVSQHETAPQLPAFEIEQQQWEVPLEGELKIPFKIAQRSSLPGDLKLRLRDLSGLRDGMTKLVLDEKTSEGVLEFRVTNRGNDFMPGRYTFSTVGLGEVTYRKQVDELARADEENSRMEQLVKRQVSEAKRITEAQETSPKALAETAAQARAAERERRKAERRLREAAERANPRKVSVTIHSRALDLTIHPAPITLAAVTVPRQLQPGASLEVPVSIKRLFGYQEAVQISLNVPIHLTGIRAGLVTIPKGETSAALVLQLSPDLRPGDYQLKLQAKLQLNERDLQVEQPLVIQVRSGNKSQKNQASREHSP